MIVVWFNGKLVLATLMAPHLGKLADLHEFGLKWLCFVHLPALLRILLSASNVGLNLTMDFIKVD